MTFDWAVFLEPITPTALLSSLIIGLAFGYIIYGKRVWDLNHVYWMFATGVVFFIPLAIEAGLERLEGWEHLLSRLVLWDVFILGTALTPVTRRVIHRRRKGDESQSS